MTNTFSITVKADTNDADYIEQTSDITQEQIDRFRPLFSAMILVAEHKRNHDWNGTYNWPDSEYRDEGTPKSVYEPYGISEEIIEEFGDFVPYGEYGVHTIESITIREIVGTNIIKI